MPLDGVQDQAILAKLQLSTEINTILHLIDKQLRGKPIAPCIAALGTALCALAVQQGMKPEDVQKAVGEYMKQLDPKTAPIIIVPGRDA